MEIPQSYQAAAWIATVGFAGLTVFHLLLAAGAPLGRLAWRGKYVRLPLSLRMASLFSAGLLVFGAICVLERTGVIELLGQPRIVGATVWTLAVIFGLSAMGNVLSGGKLEKRVMTPVALTLCLACLAVAFAP